MDVAGLVSLPFSDHCEPLFDRLGELSAVLEFMAEEMRKSRSSSLELRPRFTMPAGLSESASYYLQTLNLARPAEQIFTGFTTPAPSGPFGGPSARV